MSAVQTPSPTTVSESPTIIELQPHDDRVSLRYRLNAVVDGRVVLVLPWELDFLSRVLDFDLLRREAGRQRKEVAVVSADPERRQLARECGVPAFSTVEAAHTASRWKARGDQRIEAPPTPWWEPEVVLHRERERPRPAWLRWMGTGARLGVFGLVVLVLAATAYAIGPRAEVTLVPAGATVAVNVQVAVNPEIESTQYFGGEAATGETGAVAGIVPTRRVGLEVERTAEVETTGTQTVVVGRATGEVLFINLLPQDYVVPAGTIVRTSSASYPIRFRTTADVVLEANGQGTASITALDERTGNVGALQVNRVEGVVGSAVRVINPRPTKGAEPKDIQVVTQGDYDRVREQLTQELLNDAHYELHSLLEPYEFLPRESLRVESVPKKAFSHFVGEESETVSLNLRLLISGQAVDTADVRGIAYRGLVEKLGPDHQLIEADFDIGAVSEDQDGLGWFTVPVSGLGYAAAALDPDEVARSIRGRPVSEAQMALMAGYPLAETPQITIWPKWPDVLGWLRRVPLLPIRTEVRVVPQASSGAAGS